ncbi:MAG: alpha/beta hydrolase, partial [Planctomycetota bacterium]
TRGMPDLQVWHTVKLSNEFNRSRYGSEITFEQYRDLENELFAELDKKVFSEADSSKQDRYNRYTLSSSSSPDRFSQNWNRSFELAPERIEGGVLLIHGLTDSPYSMKYLAEIFYEANYYVLALRMPGHGTVPAGLTDVSWKDWMAVVEMGVRHVKQKAGSNRPFYIAGYSNGGALSLLYALESLESDECANPDRVFLFSPAIGITKFAAMARWLKLTSVVTYFEKSKWSSILPEYDPFKYNSFPLNAGEQSYNLSRKIKKSILDQHDKGTLSKLPPVMTFQSAVDSTVIASDVLAFYEKLSPNSHKLIVFDTNRSASLQDLMKTPPLKPFNESRKEKKLGYRLDIITNENPDSRKVVIKTKEESGNISNDVLLNMSWPDGIYSLSHLAILIPIDDPLYGTNPVKGPCSHIQLGNINTRGERNVLRISEKDLMRLRCNPFWDFVKSRIQKAIMEDKQKKLLN